MIEWQTQADALGPSARREFSSLAAIFALHGEVVSRGPMSDVIRVEADGKRYYVKRYTAGGKHLRRWLGTPRVEAEWRNLERFRQWGIPTARWVAYGQERHFGLFRRGAIITEELPGTVDLGQLARRADVRLGQREFMRGISRQVAQIARDLHARRFAHNDLHWRNLLLDESNVRIYLIDCPSGNIWWRGPVLDYRIAKDLASLDKLARTHLSRSQRLRFYLDYAGKDRLEAADKAGIGRIMRAYGNRLRRKGLPESGDTPSAKQTLP